jgi:hypothetical protein
MLLAALVLCSAVAWGQSQNGSLSGQVTDKTGAAIPQAAVTLNSTARNIPQTATTDNEGRYSFASSPPGTYELTIDAKGFKTYVKNGIEIAVNQPTRADAQLEVGDASTKIEVTADVVQLNLDNGAKQEGVAPDIVNQLPLLVSAGTPRNVLQFATFLPGVNTGTSVQTFNARINGGLRMGDEAVMDGVSMQEGTMSQSGIVSFFDFAQTPDMTQEVRLLTSSYEPEYGTTTGGEMIVTTKSGTDQIHASVFEYLRNRDLNALQFTNNRGPGDQRPKDNENEYGFSGGLPIKLKFLPFVWGPKHKTYFFNDTEFLRSLGGASRALLSIPSVQDRTGNFSDWSTPIYDPKTETINNGAITRVPYPNNQIPTSDQSALALQWMKYLPTPTAPGSTNNFLAPPVSDGILSNLNEYLFRIDHYWGEKDHFFFTIWRQVTQPIAQCQLPVQLCSANPANPEDAWVNRFNWDHIFSPTLLSHFAYGYLNRNEGYGSVPAQNPADLPHIPNAAAYLASPGANFSGNGVSNYAGWGNTAGLGALNKTTRPSNIVNELITSVHGAHTIKFGGEFRHLQQVWRQNGNQSGTVDFTAGATGLPGVDSGNPFASFLVGAVDYGNLNVYNIAHYGAEQHAFSLHVGDTWKATPKLTVNYGLRWDKFSPTWESNDYMTFFSFADNPGAGNLPGSLAFSGTKWGAASAGVRYPENEWNGAFAPRVGLAYAVSDKTVVRAGYGLFYTQAFYPGWGGGMSLDGFNPSVAFGDSLAGYQPAFNLDSGFPAYSRTEDISASADNGHGGPNYRPAYANHLSNTQQWNLTIEHKFGQKSFASVAYVASKGTHLPSQMQPLNVLNPSLLSMGSTLNAVFQPGQQTLDGVSQPYAGWAQQLISGGGCAPSVAQALVAFPQYCGGLTGENENEGTSHYNSFQAKWGRNLSNGIYVEANYTYSHLTTDASSTTQATSDYGGIGAVISPYQGSRNMAISTDDIPNTASIMAVYDVPFGKGKQFLNNEGVLGHIVGGWTLASTMKFTSGMPFYFRDSSVCGIPSQFQAACIPAITGTVLAQSWGNVDVNKPMFNASAFASAAPFTLGSGPRVSDVRGSPYRDVNLSLSRKFALRERLGFEVRAEAFNAFNNHYFTCDGEAFGDCIPFNNDPSSASFGAWNGTVTQPRNIQLVGRITF